MTEPIPATDHHHSFPAPSTPPDSSATVAPAAAAPLLPSAHQYAGPGTGPVGKVRSTGVCMLLCIVTLGVYSWVWYYQTHEEMKRHTGEGIGGALGLVIAFFAGIVSAFLSPAEVGRLYERRGQRAPVSAVTGLWAVLGVFVLVGPIVWFVKTNGALNAYWRSLGAQG
jgi:hypothetical protein